MLQTWNMNRHYSHQVKQIVIKRFCRWSHNNLTWCHISFSQISGVSPGFWDQLRPWSCNIHLRKYQKKNQLINICLLQARSGYQYSKKVILLFKKTSTIPLLSFWRLGQYSFYYVNFCTRLLTFFLDGAESYRRRKLPKSL